MAIYDESVRRLIEEGVVRPASAAFPADLLERGPLCAPTSSVLEALLEERDTGR